MLRRVLLDGLLSLGAIMMPLLLIATAVCSMAAWHPGTEPAATLELLFAAGVFACWALWSYLSGPVRIRLWTFGAASVLNALMGANILMNRKPHSIEIGAVFLVCSLWQFFVFRRRWTPAP